MFNNAGQHWNHIHFWNALSPNGGSCPASSKPRSSATSARSRPSRSSSRPRRPRSSVRAGPGWCWVSDGKLKITKTPNGSNPLATGEGKPLLGLDVWEHSYYVDFRNRRPDYVTNFLDKLANYEFAEANLG